MGVNSRDIGDLRRREILCYLKENEGKSFSVRQLSEALKINRVSLYCFCCELTKQGRIHLHEGRPNSFSWEK